MHKLARGHLPERLRYRDEKGENGVSSRNDDELRRRREEYRRQSADQHAFQIVMTAQNAVDSVHICVIERSVRNIYKLARCSYSVNSSLFWVLLKTEEPKNCFSGWRDYKQTQNTLSYKVKLIAFFISMHINLQNWKRRPGTVLASCTKATKRMFLSPMQYHKFLKTISICAMIFVVEYHTQIQFVFISRISFVRPVMFLINKQLKSYHYVNDLSCYRRHLSFGMRSSSAAGISKRLEDRKLPSQIFNKQPSLDKLLL